MLFYVQQKKESYALLCFLLEDINPIAIIRTLINHNLKLLSVQSKIKQGASYEEAVASLKPPIFFTYQQQFKQQIYDIINLKVDVNDDDIRHYRMVVDKMEKSLLLSNHMTLETFDEIIAERMSIP